MSENYLLFKLDVYSSSAKEKGNYNAYLTLYNARMTSMRGLVRKTIKIIGLIPKAIGECRDAYMIVATPSL